MRPSVIPVPKFLNPFRGFLNVFLVSPIGSHIQQACAAGAESEITDAVMRVAEMAFANILGINAHFSHSDNDCCLYESTLDNA